MIEPDDVEGIVDDDAMHATMLIGGNAELPARIVAKMLVQGREAIRARGFRPVVGVVSDRLVLLRGERLTVQLDRSRNLRISDCVYKGGNSPGHMSVSA